MTLLRPAQGYRWASRSSKSNGRPTVSPNFDRGFADFGHKLTDSEISEPNQNSPTVDHRQELKIDLPVVSGRYSPHGSDQSAATTDLIGLLGKVGAARCDLPQSEPIP